VNDDEMGLNFEVMVVAGKGENRWRWRNWCSRSCKIQTHRNKSQQRQKKLKTK
jgi:ribosomal protein L16 Arg81 hydroxylase